MNKVQFNIFDALGKLQTLKNRRYNAAQITEIINGMHGEKVITRQTIARLLRKGDTVISAVSDSTIGYLLDFFEQEGMPIAINNLFTIVNEPKPVTTEPVTTPADKSTT